MDAQRGYVVCLNSHTAGECQEDPPSPLTAHQHPFLWFDPDFSPAALVGCSPIVGFVPEVGSWVGVAWHGGIPKGELEAENWRRAGPGGQSRAGQAWGQESGRR